MRPAAATGAVGVALALVAGLFDAEPLWVPAVMLVAIGASAAAWVLAGARAVHVQRTISARRVVEDDPVDVVLTVGAGGLGLPTGLLDDPMLPAPLALAVGRRGQQQRLRVRFGRRGRRRLPSPRVIVRDPLGLATRIVDHDGGESDLLVLPRVSPVVVAGPGGGDGTALTGHGRPRAGAQVDLDGVRALRTGTPASRIFWPSLARGGEMMERRLQADADTRPLVVLDPRAGADAEGEADLDAAVRATASLIVHLARAGGCAALIPGEHRPAIVDPALAGWAHLHARLALVDRRSRVDLATLGGRRGPIFFVVAQRVSRPPRALQGSHGSSRVLVVPAPIAGRRIGFTVAGCAGYALADARVRPAVA